MSDPAPSPVEREQMMSAMFANLVVSQGNLALMMLGVTPHPHTGERFHDLDSARLFIDQLEMVEFKTRGNLSKEEAALLARTLTQLRLTFVEVLKNPPPKDAPEAKQPAGAPPTPPA
ncbi:MAG: DUF1844 domain-containing protein [Verrucomicrobia bacterium]|nr:DUF1844 domain-containing protein [Verrucomicrobiota bacterium]